MVRAVDECLEGMSSIIRGSLGELRPPLGSESSVIELGSATYRLRVLNYSLFCILTPEFLAGIDNPNLPRTVNDTRTHKDDMSHIHRYRRMFLWEPILHRYNRSFSPVGMS